MTSNDSGATSRVCGGVQRVLGRLAVVLLIVPVASIVRLPAASPAPTHAPAHSCQGGGLTTNGGFDSYQIRQAWAMTCAQAEHLVAHGRYSQAKTSGGLHYRLGSFKCAVAWTQFDTDGNVCRDGGRGFRFVAGG